MLFILFTILEALLVWEITGSVKSFSYRRYFGSFVIFSCAFIIVKVKDFILWLGHTIRPWE